MSFPELLDAARALPREEQLQLAEALLASLAGVGPTAADEELLRRMFPPGVVHDVYSPHDSYGAAVALQELLDAQAARQ
ncbi:MAG TPA: hypothetical protein VD866_10930 [Urbifossiella sp.]|nr:hypothetical protein [Urbifossiella sp.]